jgi:hypothetical protein
MGAVQSDFGAVLSCSNSVAKHMASVDPAVVQVFNEVGDAE